MLVTSFECWFPALMQKYSGCWWPKWPKLSPTSFNCNQNISSPSPTSMSPIIPALSLSKNKDHIQTLYSFSIQRSFRNRSDWIFLRLLEIVKKYSRRIGRKAVFIRNNISKILYNFAMQCFKVTLIKGFQWPILNAVISIRNTNKQIRKSQDKYMEYLFIN